MVEKATLTARKPEANAESPVARMQQPELSQFMRSPADRIVFLQGTYGNQAMQRLLKSRVIQAKLSIGEPGDKYEQEADRVADRVVSSAPIQRKCASCNKDEDEKKLVQRKVENTSATASVPDSFIQNLGAGQPLDPATRAFFEPRFGHDFSGVRVHADGRAAESARAVNARAFTVGMDVVFGEGEYAPEIPSGQRLMAHELTHVVQQQDVFHGVKKQRHLIEPAPMIQFQKAKPASRLKIHGADTKEDVYRFLAHIKSTLPGFRGLTTGRMIGNKLEYGNRNYELYPGVSLEDLTISSKLGEGVFLLRPIPRTRLGLVALMAGAAYEIERVDPSGTLYRSGVEVITAGLGSISEGILVYSPRKLIMAEVVIEARRPRDTSALAQSVIETMDDAGSVLNPGLTVTMLMYHIERASLNDEEMMDLLRKLKPFGRLGEFLNLVRITRFRKFLRQKGVEWSYIYENWEPSFNDSGLLFTGFLIGAGESVWDAIRLIGILIGGDFSEDLARERTRFFAAIKQFFAHPIINTVSGLKALKSAIEEALWNLDFFTAGRILGNLVVVILTLPEAIRALPKVARALAKAAVTVGRMTLQAAKELGVTLRTMADFMRQPIPSVVLDNGVMLMKAGDEVLVLDNAGSPVGRIVPKEFSPSEIAEWERTFKEPGRPPGTEKPITTVPAFLDLEDIVSQAIAKVRAQLGSTWLPARHFGTRLHAAVEEIINSVVKAPKGWRVFAEQPMSTIAKLPPKVAKLTLRDYLATRPHLKKFLEIPAEMLDSEIGNLIPDLVIQEPGKAAVIWDLTSRNALVHLAKTELYAHILQDLGNFGFVRWGETYWSILKGSVSPTAVIPTGVAASVGKKKP